jgi:hypothetical protein
MIDANVTHEPVGRPGRPRQGPPDKDARSRNLVSRRAPGIPRESVEHALVEAGYAHWALAGVWKSHRRAGGPALHAYLRIAHRPAQTSSVGDSRPIATPEIEGVRRSINSTLPSGKKGKRPSAR